MAINHESDVKRLSSLTFASTGVNVLYSGENNAKRAEVFARKTNAKTIHDTEGGRYIDGPDRYQAYTATNNNKKIADAKADNVWGRGSKNFVANIKGPVRTFVVGAGPRRIFRPKELTAALNNKDIPTINGVKRAVLAAGYTKDLARGQRDGLRLKAAKEYARDRAFRRISVAELRLTQKEIRLGQKDPKEIKQHHVSRQRYLDQKIKEAKSRAQERGSTYKGPEPKSGQQKRDELKFKVARDVARVQGLNEAQAKKVADHKLTQFRTQNQSSGEQARRQRSERATQIYETTKEQNQPGLKAQRATSKAAEQKLQTRQAVSTQKSAQQPTARITSNSRIEAIYSRAQQSALNRGASPENARLAAQTRVEHVRTKVALSHERAAVRATPTKQAAQAYVNKAVDFQAKRVADLQVQAKRENTAYRGPAPRAQAYQDFQKRTDPRELASRAQLQIRRNAGQIGGNAYTTAYASQEKSLLQTRADNFKQAHGYDYNQRSTFETKPITSSYDHALHSYTYHQPAYHAPISPTHNNPHSNNSYGHGVGYDHGHGRGH